MLIFQLAKQTTSGDLQALQSLDSPSYTILDFLSDFMSNPGGIFKVGGSDDPADFPPIKPAGDFQQDVPAKGQRIALVAHSASGWISRLYLSSLEYQGRSFNGADRIHSLVCLGSPHFVADNLVFKNLEYLESRNGKDLPPNVRCLCVGSKGSVKSEASEPRRLFGGCFMALALQQHWYQFDIFPTSKMKINHKPKV